MCIAAAIMGSAVVGGVVASNAAGDAADAQVDAARTASQTELAMFNQNRKDMQPWRDAGTQALDQLTAGTVPGGQFDRKFTLADFNKDPGYQFRMDEGQRGIEAGAAARGGVLNGGTLKALTRYGQDFASGEYNNVYNRFNNDQTTRFNRLSSLAGTGQTATRDVATMGTQVAGNIANNQIGAGNARASGYVGTANAVNSGVQTLGNWYVQNQMAANQPAWYNNGTTSAVRGGVSNTIPLSDGTTFSGLG